jgi:hypothetical protein
MEEDIRRIHGNGEFERRVHDVASFRHGRFSRSALTSQANT